MQMRIFVLFLVFMPLILLFLPVLLLCCLFRWGKPVYMFSRWVVRLGLKILAVRIDVIGSPFSAAEEPCIYMSNHLSYLDGPIIISRFLRPTRAIVKGELFRIPILGTAMRCVNFVAVDRSGKKRGVVSIARAVAQIAEHGDSFLVFPEGTRSPDGRLQRFRRGGFYLAVNSRTRIVPISIEGSFELMPKGSSRVKKGRVSVRFHNPVPVHGLSEDDVPALIEKVRGIIWSGLNRRHPSDSQEVDA